MAKCDYGCGNKAIHTFKNGSNCCSKSVNCCPEMKRRNGLAKIGRNPFAGREHPRGMAGKTAWNSGKTKHSDKTVRAASKKIKAFRKANPTVGFTKHSTHSTEAKAKIKIGSVNNGGYREGSGRGHKGRYNGIYCDSSWELAFVLWCEIKGREVKRARKRFKYKFEGKLREYLPDFRYKTSKGEWKYLEVKGFKSEQWQAKKKAFPHDLLFIGKRVISQQILPLVVSVHGKDFIRLYE